MQWNLCLEIPRFIARLKKMGTGIFQKVISKTEQKVGGRVAETKNKRPPLMAGPFQQALI
jgi:hypothetical protein